MNTKPKYPFITCSEHPGCVEPGYMICKHVTTAGGFAPF